MVGENMKQLELSAEKAVEREEKLKEFIMNNIKILFFFEFVNTFPKGCVSIIIGATSCNSKLRAQLRLCQL